MQKQIGEQWADYAALRRTLRSWNQSPVLSLHWRFQPAFDPGTTNEITGGLAIGDTAFEVAVNSQTNTIYVPTNTIVAVIDGNTNSVTNKINRPAPSSSDPVDLPQIVVNETTNTVFVSNVPGQAFAFNFQGRS